MSQVSVAIDLPCSVHEAETAWSDTGRWPQWVDQLARVLEVREPWPEVGSSVVWESGPAGRGRVSERVISYEPLHGLETEVEDDSIRGRQEVTFEPVAEGVQVRLTLDYRLRRRTIFTPLVDWLFIRAAMGRSMSTTLARFSAEVRGRARG